VKLLRWLPVFLWLIAICWLSFSSLEKVPLPSFIGWDKLGHFFMYFLLELLFLYALDFKKKGVFIWSLLVIVFSAITELIQHFFIINRYGEWADFFANTVGIIIAYLVIRRKIKN
jgi:VanZ family protein